MSGHKANGSAPCWSEMERIMRFKAFPATMAKQEVLEVARFCFCAGIIHGAQKPVMAIESAAVITEIKRFCFYAEIRDVQEGIIARKLQLDANL